MTEDAPQRAHALCEVVHGLRWIVRASACSARRTEVPWRIRTNDPPPWSTVSPPTQRWRQAGVVAPLVHARRAQLRAIEGRAPAPRAATVDARAMPATPDSGARVGDDGHQRCTGRKGHVAVDPLVQSLTVAVR
jgi:transposase